MIHPKFGFLPSDIKLTKIFFKGKYRIGVQAGDIGWVINYPNLSIDYENNYQSPEKNLEKAISKLLEKIPEVTEKIEE